MAVARIPKAMQLCSTIKLCRKADIVSTTGKGIVTLQQLPMLTPRGRYNIEMFPTFMRLHGKTYDYKIMFSNISRFFQLPKPDGRHVYFVVCHAVSCHLYLEQLSFATTLVASAHSM
jgi:structure-specific recognition protein 1